MSVFAILVVAMAAALLLALLLVAAVPAIGIGRRRPVLGLQLRFQHLVPAKHEAHLHEEQRRNADGGCSSHAPPRRTAVAEPGRHQAAAVGWTNRACRLGVAMRTGRVAVELADDTKQGLLPW